jgi:hypothetical protein
MNSAIIGQVSSGLSVSFGTIIVASLVLAVGLGLMAGLAWLYIWTGKWMWIGLRKVYQDAMETVEALSEKPEKNGKRKMT